MHAFLLWTLPHHRQINNARGLNVADKVGAIWMKFLCSDMYLTDAIWADDVSLWGPSQSWT